MSCITTKVRPCRLLLRCLRSRPLGGPEQLTASEVAGVDRKHVGAGGGVHQLLLPTRRRKKAGEAKEEEEDKAQHDLHSSSDDDEPYELELAPG